MAARTRGRGKGRRGVLITFEGVEGSGKSTQCARLAKLLREDGRRVVETREPGGTPLAERIRSLLLTGPSTPSSASAEPIDPRCEAHLVLACRSQHVAQVIEPRFVKAPWYCAIGLWTPPSPTKAMGAGWTSRLCSA